MDFVARTSSHLHRLEAAALALVLALSAPRLAAALCSGSTYSYGSGACSSCAVGASFVSSSAGCVPSATLTAGPADTAFYLSGSQAEGVAAFAAPGAAPSFVAGPFGASSGALQLTAPAATAPPGTTMLAAWYFTEGAGSSVANSLSPTSLTGVFQGSQPPTWAAGPFPASYSGAFFAGSMIVPGGAATLFGSSPAFSVSMWMMMPSSGHGFRDFLNTNVLGFQVVPIDGSGTCQANLFFGGMCGAGVTICGQSANAFFVTPGVWYHVVIVVDRQNNDLSIFVDGTLAVHVQNTDAAGRPLTWGTSCPADTGDLFIGNGPFQGYISSISVMSGAVDAAGAQKLFVTDIFRSTGTAGVSLPAFVLGSSQYAARCASTGAQRASIVRDPASHSWTLQAAGEACPFVGASSPTAIFVPGASAPAALPSGGSVAWSASAWVKCAAPATWAGILEWGAAGDAQGAASTQTAALVVAGPAAMPDGIVTTLAGSGNQAFANGVGAAASFNQPTGVAAIPSSGVMVVTDCFNHRIRFVDPTSGTVTTLAGSGTPNFADGMGASASFNYPSGVAVIPSTSLVFVADCKNHRIRLVTPLGVVSTLAGSGTASFSDGAGAAASFNCPQGVALFPSGGVVAVADQLNHRVRLVTYPSGIVTTLAGSGSAAFADGLGTSASFNNPLGVTVISLSGAVVVADHVNNRIRLVTPLGVVTTLAGSGSGTYADGTGTAASFFSPVQVAVLPWGGQIITVDRDNHRIRLVTPLGVVTTLAGSGSADFADGTGAAASFNRPVGVAVIPSSGTIVVADTYNNRIRLIRLITGFAPSACDSTWHHVALTYSPSSTPYSLKAFLDGALAFQLAATITLPAASASTLRIGWSGNLTVNAGSLFAGSLAELRVYNRTLAASEVLALSQPPLAAYANTAVVPAAPTLGATSYTFSCAAQALGAGGVLAKSGADGSWAWAAGIVPACVFCAAGSYFLNAACAPCSPGTYSLAGALSCSLCPAGTFGDHAGLATAACSGVCASCTAGSTAALHAPLTCSAGAARAVPSSLGLQIWPAANPANARGVDLLVAPLALCRQMTSAAACAAADSVVGADGTTRFVVGTAAAFNVEPAEAMTCGGEG
jgi:hypothetical protein